MTHQAAADALNGLPTEDETMLDADEADEEIPEDADAAMDSGDDDTNPTDQGLTLQNDSIAHFDAHSGNSIFCIAQHPLHPSIIATGGGENDEDKEEGFGFVFDVGAASQSQPQQAQNTEREGIKPLQRLAHHTDSITSIAFTLPGGAYLCTAGMDGRLAAYAHVKGANPPYAHLSTVQEVEETTFLSPCPHPDHPNTIALGAVDGSIWVYTIDASDKANPLQILQTYYIHTGRAEAGAWTPDGKLLATVSEDGSLYVWDVFGEAAASGLVSGGQQYVVGLTAEDERFKVEGGLFSVAISPNGAYVAVGGAEGQIRVVGLPRFSDAGANTSKSGAGAKSKSGGSKQAAEKTSAGQAGAILASLGVQSNSVETLSFAAAPLTLLASGSTDGSIVVFDTSKNFAVRRKIDPQSGPSEVGEDGDAITQVQFVNGGAKGGDRNWLLTSCGFDGVVRRWDLRSARGSGLVGEWRGHRGDGEGGYVQGFVQGLNDGRRVVTAGDDGVSLLFDMDNVPA